MRLRRSVRLPGHAYDAGLYFVTVCTHDRAPLFGSVRDGEVHLTTPGWIAREEWLRTPDHRPEVVADAFVVMPDHVHLLFGTVPSRAEVPTVSRCARRGTARCAPAPSDPGRRFGGMASSTVPAIVRSYKSAVTRGGNQARGTPGPPVWQRGYHDRVVRSDREAAAVRRYIAENPMRWRVTGRA